MNEIVLRAFEFALRVHKDQTRKDGKPYICHPFSVAIELAKNGADDNLICAGLLHDTVEDGGITPAEIEKFGEDVSKPVLFDTENKSLSWKERKEATIHALENCDRRCAMLVCADKLSNISDIANWLKTEGESMWTGFKCGRETQEWLYRKYVAALSQLSDLRMYKEFKETVETVFGKKEL